MLWPKTRATHYHAQLGLSTKGLVVCNRWDLESLDLLNGPRLLSTVPLGMNRMKEHRIQIHTKLNLTKYDKKKIVTIYR